MSATVGSIVYVGQVILFHNLLSHFISAMSATVGSIVYVGQVILFHNLLFHFSKSQAFMINICHTEYTEGL